MYPSQSNTQQGLIAIQSGADLTGTEGKLVKLGNSSGTPIVTLLAAITDRAYGVVLEGAASGSKSIIQPLAGISQVRIVAKGTGATGALAVPATTGDFGKVRADGAGLGGGSSQLVGIFMESFTDGQLALVALSPGAVITLTT